MLPVKDLTLELIKNLPNDITFENILEEITFQQQIYEGLKQASEGKVISIDEFKRRRAELRRGLKK